MTVPRGAAKRYSRAKTLGPRAQVHCTTWYSSPYGTYPEGPRRGCTVPWRTLRVVRGTVCKLGKEKRHGRTAVRGNVGVSADHRITSLALYNFARKRGVAYLRWSAQRLLCGRGKVFTALWTRPY